MKRIILAVAALVAWCSVSASAQNVTVIGPITPGDCVMFNSTTVIKDGGFPCPGAGGTLNLPNGTTATTQAPGDNTTKVATDAFVQSAISANPITIGTTAIVGGTNDFVLFDNAGVVGNAPMWHGGQISMYPNPNNNPGSGPANQVAQTGFGVPINILSTTTGGLAEMELQAATIGWPMIVSQFGITSAGTNPQFIGTSTTWTTHPRGIWSIDIDDATVNCTMVDGTNCVAFDSAEIGRFRYSGQIVYNSTGDTVLIKPITQTPNDHLVVFSLNDFSVTTLVGAATSEALLKIDATTTPGLGIQQNVFNFKELNGGITGIKVMNPAALSGGLKPIFNHNITTATAIHGQTTAGIQVGQSTTRQTQMDGNIWTALFTSSAQVDGLVTYESHSEFHIGANDQNTITNCLHFKSGATNNVAIMLDVIGCSVPVLDDNAPGGGNIIIGNGNITVGGSSIAVQNSNVTFANIISTTNITTPILKGGTANASILTLQPSSSATPTGNVVQITQTGFTSLFMGWICTGNAGFPGFAVGNNGQADCTHYSFMGDGTNTYFNAFLGGIISFRNNNGEIFQVNATGMTMAAGTKINLVSAAWINTAPTISAGFCATSPSISASNGVAAFDINVGTACAGSVGTLSLPAATTGWVCTFANVTNPNTNIVTQTGGATNTVTLTNYVRTTGVAGNFTASDHIRGKCTGY